MNSDNSESSHSSGVNAPPRSNKSKRKWISGLLVLVIAVGLGVGIAVYWDYRRTHVETDDAFIDGHVYTVAPRVAGQIAEMLVEDNEVVEKGQVLVKLDASEFENNLKIAKYNLKVAENQVAGEVGSVPVVRAQSAGLKAQLAYAEKQKERADDLRKVAAISQSAYDQAYARWKALSDQLKASRRQRKEILARLGPRSPDGEVADVELARARVDEAELQLGFTTIRSPIRGQVTRRNADVGEVVAPGQTMMTIVPLEGLYVTANYKETELTNVRVGQRVSIHVDTYPGVALWGRVAGIMAGTGAAFSMIPPENATGNFIKVVQRVPVKIVLNDQDHPLDRLRIGMSVEPTILVEDP